MTPADLHIEMLMEVFQNKVNDTGRNFESSERNEAEEVTLFGPKPPVAQSQRDKTVFPNNPQHSVKTKIPFVVG